MTLLVTGASGFMGRALVARLAKQHDVVGLVRSPGKAAIVEALGARPVLGDITDRSSLDAAMQGCRAVFHLAAAVGEAGKVIAVDVEQSLVDHMTARATEEGTPQVQARLGAYADPKLAEAEVDLILLVDTYHHIDGRRDYFGRLRAALKPGGRLVIVDWAKGDNPVGPKDDHKIEPEQVQSELIDVGWAPLAAKPAVDLPYQYVVMFALDPAARSSAPPSE